jgi:hypothetical protein
MAMQSACWFVVAIVIAARAVGCTSSGCDDAFVTRVLHVMVTDRATGNYVCNATVQARNTRTGAVVQLPNWSDTGGDCVYSGLDDSSEDQATVWEVTAGALGYKDGVASVEVGHDGCHIDSADATIALDKS